MFFNVNAFLIKFKKSFKLKPKNRQMYGRLCNTNRQEFSKERIALRYEEWLWINYTSSFCANMLYIKTTKNKQV